jgi:hypothetical protein
MDGFSGVVPGHHTILDPRGQQDFVEEGQGDLVQ